MLNPVFIAALLSVSATSFAQDRYFLGASNLKPLSTHPVELELRLQNHDFGATIIGTTFNSVNLSTLVKAYGKSINSGNLEFEATNLPAGLTLSGHRITGAPINAGSHSFTIRARYGDASIAKTYTLTAYNDIVENAEARTWRDGSFASSCAEYISSTDLRRYEGATGDGVYRIEPVPGQPLNVYCDMTRDGGGWTLVMKQAQGDGVTLQGDTTYWTNGTPLNDTLTSLNKNNGNYVSSVFTKLQVKNFRLEASNESTMKYEVKQSATTPLSAFSNSNAKTYTDSPGIPQQYPDWFIRTTKYETSENIVTSRFDFNYQQVYQNTIYCAVRWGWTSNENPEVASSGSHDACGGLGGYGVRYGNHHMQNNKNVWQTATLYLWVK